MQALAHELAYGDPLDALARLARLPGVVFFDSALPDEERGRYSFIAADPFLVLRTESGGGDPFPDLARLLARSPLAARPGLPPFQGGVAGYFGYDLARHLERLPAHRIDDLRFPDLLLGCYDLVLAFDHARRSTFAFSSGLPEESESARGQRAKARLDEFLARLGAPAPRPIEGASSPPPVADLARADFLAMVRRAIDYIHAGDIYQANLSHRFRAPLPAGFDRLALYRRLRRRNPAPFAAYLDFGDVALASASPERFLKLRRGHVETRPIKGTRPRGATPEADRALGRSLLESEKDRAENLMIVDLLRNDLSRVCRVGSVRVPSLFALESFATVHHLVSTVTGELRPRRSAVDLLRAAFPGGSVTGAPKIRAMEIIAELEPTARGPYCGSIGYIGFDGAMDSSIVIRTYAIKDRMLTFQVGGGIVADSDPAAEYDETLDKARALIEALDA